MEKTITFKSQEEFKQAMYNGYILKSGSNTYKYDKATNLYLFNNDGLEGCWANWKSKFTVLNDPTPKLIIIL